MKALFLAASGAAAAVALSASAAASVITLGGSFARDCFLAADSQLATAQAIGNCDSALAFQDLTERDRLATHVNRGILRMLRREFAAAKADFDQAIAIDASEPEIWLNHGIVAFNEGDSRRAVAMFERALSLGTKYQALAYYARGLANEDSGNLKAAYADLNRAKAIRPDWSAPVKELARYQVR